MPRRIIVFNEYARTLDTGGIKKVPVHSLRAGDVLSGSGETVIRVQRTMDGQSEFMLGKNKTATRLIRWNNDVQVGILSRANDGVGSAEEIAYGEGWHSSANANPYTSTTEKAAWERGRAAKRQKQKLNTNYRRGELRNKQYEAPHDFKSEKGFVAKIIDVKTGGTLARSEPYISNGPGLKKWIQEKAQELIRAGKRVKAEITVEFFDPERI